MNLSSSASCIPADAQRGLVDMPVSKAEADVLWLPGDSPKYGDRWAAILASR